MKINYLAMSDIPSHNANALQITQMCNAISEIGHKVNLFVPSFYHTDEISIKKYYGIKNSFKIVRVGTRRKVLSKLDNILLPILIIINSLKNRSDLIITRNLVISLFLLIIRKKHILEIHDDPIISGKLTSRIFKLLKLFNSKRFTKIIFITNSLKKFISKNYIYRGKNFKIVPDASSIIIDKSKLKLNYKKMNLGYFGSIYKSRGIELITKLARIDKDNNYFIFGGKNQEVRKLKTKNNYKNLFFFEQVPYYKVPTFISKMDILLLPYTKRVTSTGNIGNIIDFMSPMKMFDYLRASKKIICSDIPVLKEVLKNNYNAILIKNFENEYAWKQEINKNKYNIIKHNILKKNAFRTSQKFTWKKRAEEILMN